MGIDILGTLNIFIVILWLHMNSNNTILYSIDSIDHINGISFKYISHNNPGALWALLSTPAGDSHPAHTLLTQGRFKTDCLLIQYHIT